MDEPTKKELFILDAKRTNLDGTVEQLSAEEALTFMYPGGNIEGLPDGYITISWIEGQPEQILNILLGYPYFETEDTNERKKD